MGNPNRRPRGAAGHYLTDEMIEDAALLYRLGASLRVVGSHFGVSGQSIHYHLKDRVTLRNRGTRSKL